MNFNYSNYLLLRHRNVPGPFSITLANTNSNRLGGNSQNEILLSLGNREPHLAYLLIIYSNYKAKPIKEAVSCLAGLCLHPLNGIFVLIPPGWC